MTEAVGEELRRAIGIADPRGLHARAAGRFVKLAGSFDAVVMVARDDMVVSGISIMGLMMLSAGPGTEIELRVSGNEATEALAALVELVAGGFDED